MLVREGVTVDIKQLDESHYLFERFIFLQGLNGVLPELRLWLATSEDDIEDEVLDIDVKAAGLEFTTKGFIYERSKVLNRSLELKMYLMPKTMVYGRSADSYTSVKEVVSALNEMDEDKLPTSYPEFPCNQMMETASEYLTKALLCSKSGFAFYYGWDNKVHGVDMASTSEDVEITYENNDSNISEGRISAKYNPLEDIEITTEDLTTSSVHTSNYHRVGSIESSEAYHNYSLNKALLNRHNEVLKLTLMDFNKIHVGDNVKLAVTKSLSKIYRCVFLTFGFLNNELSMEATLKLINE